MYVYFNNCIGIIRIWRTTSEFLHFLIGVIHCFHHLLNLWLDSLVSICHSTNIKHMLLSHRLITAQQTSGKYQNTSKIWRIQPIGLSLISCMPKQPTFCDFSHAWSDCTNYYYYSPKSLKTNFLNTTPKRARLEYTPKTQNPAWLRL